jgi:hypothetical protein
MSSKRQHKFCSNYQYSVETNLHNLLYGNEVNKGYCTYDVKHLFASYYCSFLYVYVVNAYRFMREFKIISLRI